MIDTLSLAEQGLIPDRLMRWGVQRISRRRLLDEGRQDHATRMRRLAEWSRGPIAVQTEQANSQHYEVPSAFYERVLGPHLKYSCCWFDGAHASLDDAEAAMLEIYAERARLGAGQKVLDLGCGWGSFTLWAAARHPESQFTAVSNSSSQRRYIEAQARRRGLDNVSVITADINTFEPMQTFDRIVSVEMMEHVRNHHELFRRVAGWLQPDGLAFVHVFCHREFSYAYEDQQSTDWMARHFFSGGMMPSFDLFTQYDAHLEVARRWWINGRHYEATSNEWLARADADRAALIDILGDGDRALGRLRLQRWRMFFIAVAEFFGLDGGEQWGVGHYLLRRRDALT